MKLELVKQSTPTNLVLGDNGAYSITYWVKVDDKYAPPSRHFAFYHEAKAYFDQIIVDGLPKETHEVLKSVTI